jgi:hypothetical protein
LKEWNLLSSEQATLSSFAAPFSQKNIFFETNSQKNIEVVVAIDYIRLIAV